MSQVVDQLAALTAFRDRDQVDATLATALRELLRPLQVAIHRGVGDEGDQRWLTRVRLALDDRVASSDPIWTELDDLPPLSAHPARLQALRQQAVVAVAGTPQLTIFALTGAHEPAGVLELHSVLPLDEASRRLVCSVLRIYRNFQALLDYSERDTLTGLLNRKTFEEAFYKLAGELAAADAARPAQAVADRPDRDRRTLPDEQPHFIGVIDIDHFKAVNDRHGHLIGDEVLLLLARLMRSVFRFHDRLYRFGGEEFVVLMRCAGEAEAGIAFERLRSSVQAFVFPQAGSVTVSAGFTRLRRGDTPSSAFQRADRAVYWAKGHGRNRVCGHADLVARGELDDDDRVGDVELF